MEENSSKALYFGAGVLTTVIIITFALNFFFKGKLLYNFSSNNIDQVTDAVSKSNYTKYDNTTVKGSDVINAINLYATDKFLITVKTKQDVNGITYNSPSGYKIKDLTNPDYIEPTSNFIAQIENNTNKAINKIVFTQTSSSSFQSMTNNSGKGIVITPGTQDQAVPEGYTDGSLNSIKVLGDPNLIPDNIISGKSIFGVAGSGTSGKKFASGQATVSWDGKNWTTTITGLTFKPSIIIGTSWQNGQNYVIYSESQYLKDVNGNALNFWDDIDVIGQRGQPGITLTSNGFIAKMYNYAGNGNPVNLFYWIAIGN